MTAIKRTRTLVKGGSGELGSRMTGELRSRGGRVRLAGRDGQRVQAVGNRARARCTSAVFELTQPHHAAHIVETAVVTLGGLDGVINAAGVVAFRVNGGVD